MLIDSLVAELVVIFPTISHYTLHSSSLFMQTLFVVSEHCPFLLSLQVYMALINEQGILENISIQRKISIKKETIQCHYLHFLLKERFSFSAR